MITRRQFLGASVGTTAGAAVLPSWVRAASRAAPIDSSRVLVVLQLIGGNDGLNSVVPIDDELYARTRPNLAVARSKALAIDQRNGFHPGLEHLREWYEAGHVCVVHGVGHEHSSLSHFRSQAMWDAATSAGSLSDTGWLGRQYEANLRGEPRMDSPIAMLALGRDTLPFALKTRARTWLAIPSLENALSIGADHEDADDLDSRGDRSNALARVTDSMRAARQASVALAKAENRTPLAKYPILPIARALRSVADVLAADLPTRCFYLTFPGFDTHTRQVFEHGRLLSRLDASLNAFLCDLKAQGNLDRVVVATVSEFGRRPAESGLGSDAGTDHGTASISFLIGGRVRGGIHGDQPDLADLDENGNVRYRVDFRRIYASLIEDWLGGRSETVLDGKYEKLDLFRS
jgi:uncharacterized protein (DUF1501 family)